MDKVEPHASEPIDLGGHRGGHPERLDRGAHAETLVEAEHVARYRWAAQLASGRRVLDAGCGTAYGTAMLAKAGATEVVGVDRAGDVLDAVRERMPENVTLQSAELLELPFEDGDFDMVVCFEVLEHLEDPEAGIGELARVLGNTGVLAISSPNRDAYPPGNPHHVHEYIPSELRDSLARRFANVQLLRQHAWVSSAVLEDEALTSRGDDPLEAELIKVGGGAPDTETFTLALASDQELPEIGRVAVLGPHIDQLAMAKADWETVEQHRLIADQKHRIAELEEVRGKLVEAEQALAELPALYASRSELEGIRGSTSWRLTAPLRRIKAPLRRALPVFRVRIKQLIEKVVGRISRLRG